MIERIIEIAEQSAFLNLSNNLLTIRLKDSQAVTIPVGEVQCLVLANPAVTITGALMATLAENGAVAKTIQVTAIATALIIGIITNAILTKLENKSSDK